MYNNNRGIIRGIVATVLTVVLLTGNISISAYAAEPMAGEPASEEAVNLVSEAEENDGSYEGTSVTEEESSESESYEEDTSVIENDQESTEGSTDEETEEMISEELPEEEAASDDALDTALKGPDASVNETESDDAIEIVFPEDFEGMVDEEALLVECGDSESEDPELLGASSDVLLDITGTYYTVSASTILDKLNKIRKEAYDLGYVNTYVPLKWSSAIESAARKRAMEAGITVDHLTLGSHDPTSYVSSSGQFWYISENLAWNNKHNAEGIMFGINQFYEEKSDYEARRKGSSNHGVTGHYENIIDPNVTHVGIAGCQMNCTPHGWFTVAMQLAGKADSPVDETKDNTTGVVTQTLRVSPGKIGSLSITGPTVIEDGGQAVYELGGKLKVKTYDGNVCPSFKIPSDADRGVEWCSSDPEVVTVENGVARALSGGDATITASIGTLKAECKVAVAKPTTGFTIRSQADNSDITGKVVESTVGDTLNCVCIVEPEDAYDKTIKWTSSDTGIATVTSTGESSAVIRYAGCGEAVITCTNTNAAEPIVREFTVRGSIGASAVSLDKSEVSLYAGERIKLTARILPEGTEGVITFSSGDTEVAAVSSDGEILAVSEGETVITASSGTLKSATCTVKVSGEGGLIADKPIVGELMSGVWVAADSIVADKAYTGSTVTQPGIKVYCGSRMLSEGKDYTLSYKNNIKAASADSKNAPQVTVNLKGNYQGKKTYKYSILPLDLSDSAIIEKYQLVGTETGKDVKPVPELWFKDKKLVKKTDFTCEYPDDEYRSTDKEHTVKVIGCGNYTGERTISFRIADRSHSLAKASVTVGPSDPASKKIYYRGSLTADDLKVTVKLGGEVVPESYYEITSLPDNVGKGSIRIEATTEGKAHSYYGSKTVKVTTYPDRSIKDADIEGFADSKEYDPVSIKYMGAMLQSAATLSYNGERLYEGTDYKTTYSSNKKVGTAKITYKGIGRYSGKIVKTYKITPYSGDIRLDPKTEMTYVKGGVKPVVSVTDANDNPLKEKTDYTISIRNKSNLKPGTMSYKIVGKGNYKGYVSDYIDVNVSKGDLTAAELKLSDKKYVSRGTGWKSSVKVTDSNGKTLASGKDYEKKIFYSYTGMADKKVPAAGTTVYVTVVGKGYYEGSSITRSYRIVEKNISSLVFVIKDMPYTGSTIELQPGTDIHAYASKTEAKWKINDLTSAYEIVGSSSNSASGTGTVTVRGKGSYGGTRVLKFKILKQTYEIDTGIK